MNKFIDTLLTRRSVLANLLCEPGPDEAEIQKMLAVAHRVPDHGKIGPWRFVLFSGEARAQFGGKLRDIYAKDHPEANEKLLQFEENRLTRAPLVIAVIASPELNHPKAPEWEQILAVGAVCQNLLLAANGLGFGAQWLTEWYSFHLEVDKLLEMTEHEKIAGFIYIGSFKETPAERRRPDLTQRIQYWTER